MFLAVLRIWIRRIHMFLAVLQIRIRCIHMFLALLDPHSDLLVRYTDTDPDPSVIKQSIFLTS